MVRWLALVVLSGCGRVGFDAASSADGGDDAGGVDRDPFGFWIVTGATIEGGPSPRTRDDLVGGIRGDIMLAPGTHTSRRILLSAGTGGTPSAISGSFEVAADERWVFTYESNTWVTVATWLGEDELAVRIDPTDPRAQGMAPPLQTATLQRAEPPPAALLGDWVLEAVEYAGTGVFAAGACTPDGDGDSFRLSGTLSTSSAYISSARFVFDNYNGLGCNGPATQVIDTGDSYSELTATTFRWWGDYAILGKIVVAGSIEPTVAGYRFVVTECAPAAKCPEAPKLFELGRP